MRSTLFAALLVGLTLQCFGSPLQPSPGTGRRLTLPTSQKTPRIRGGVPVGPTEIPYAAGLMIQQPLGNRFCGGSLVSVNYVLTAASCFLNPGATTVLLGASNMTIVDDIVQASEVIIHQAFAASQNLNDIALVRLARPAILTDYIRLARLPNWRQADSQFTNQLATVSGWGALGQNAQEILPLNSLRRVNGSIISNTACNLQFFGGISDDHVCIATSNGSPCQGDQGGPLTVQDADGGQTVIGIHSFISNLGCDLEWPAVFSRVTRFLAWIEANSDVTIRSDFDFQPTPPDATATPFPTTPTIPITTTIATPSVTTPVTTVTPSVSETTTEQGTPFPTTNQPTTLGTPTPAAVTLLPHIPPHRTGRPIVH
ncbi:brachyurin-like [Anopheles albimanus]|uniref:Uncharacterized protein n=1 Tax=Anopheles albimanus TaxID=7167 RepID=A0A182FC92_ANOAL|nr:brachyurin-like [Anopheles albimanus]